MKVGIVSLGCPKNQVDSEVMAGLLKKAGHTLTPDEYQADAIVVNTCSFITEATEESIDTILELSELKETSRLKYLIVAGCLSQRYKSGLVKELPEVDAYIGTGGFESIAEVLNGLTRSKAKKGETAFPEPVYLYSHDTPRVRFTPRHWGYVKISDGCNNRCTYCMIPSIRGDLRSRTAASVKAEAAMMAAQGVKEVCLIAQDITAYGDDRKKGSGLTGLLKQLEGVKGIEWIRLLYTHPAHFSEELIDFLAASKKVVRYLDIPMQHIDDDILKAMGRKIDSAGIRSLIGSIRAKMPDVAIRTSLMVGFPGETREKFTKLLRFVKEMEFDHVGVFGYSDEEGSPASAFGKKVSEELIAERRDQLMKAQNKITLKKNRARVGKTYRVLVDGPSKESEMLVAGRSYFQAPDIDGVIYITEGEVKPGAFADVEITEAHPYDLVGRAL